MTGPFHTFAATGTDPVRTRAAMIWILVRRGWAMLFADTLDRPAADLDDVAQIRRDASGHFSESARNAEHLQRCLAPDPHPTVSTMVNSLARRR